MQGVVAPINDFNGALAMCHDVCNPLKEEHREKDTEKRTRFSLKIK